MNKLPRDEILSLLGITTDPKHSLPWYANQYPDLKKIISAQIKNDLEISGFFPLEAKSLRGKKKIAALHLIIEKKKIGQFTVTRYDTDRSTIEESKDFSNLAGAIEFLLTYSSCAGGRIFDFIN
jgi:hypothetical protein